MDRRGAAVGVLLAGLWACDATLSNYDEIYSRGADHFVLCSHSLDDKNSVSNDEIAESLTRARLDGTTLHLYAHRPGDTVETSTIEGVVAAAAQRGVGFVTYEELNAGEAPGTLALSFDDHNLESWIAMRPMLDRYHARVTFFISSYTGLEAVDHAAIRQLADDGHDIQFHSTTHKNAEIYAGKHGAEAYVADEIVPALDAMRAAGYPTTVFAYPYGARTPATDAALAPYFVHLRAIRTTCPQ